MEKIADNCEKLSKDNRTDEINYLIKKLVELKETIDKYKDMKGFWNLHFFSLSMVIWADQLKCQQLQKTEANSRITIRTAIKFVRFKERKLKNFRVRRKSHFLKECGQLHIIGWIYADNFWPLQIEYSSENLSKDIKRYQEENKKIHDQLPILADKLTNLEILCGLTNPCKVTEEVSKISTVLASMTENEDNTLSKIMSTLNILKKFKEEIRQKKKALNSIRNKKFMIQRQNESTKE
ncbi:unnamed protein product [Xylocopa violacea]|uniref:Uncharacterized protein n=1 Tax=Xylocopa violacea TaxID=135666 RepID=A0ABP1P6J9_XYLVO